MPRFSIFLMLGTAVMALPADPPATAEDGRLANLFQTYLDQEFQRHPVYATQQGNHDHDDRMDDLAPDARRKDAAIARKWLGDLAKEIVETRHSGGAVVLPLIRDSMGNKLLDYTPPQGVAGYTQIFKWKQDLDLEIWKALEVPPEVIQAQTSGSGFSGRWIPFAVALSAVHQELAELIRCIDRDILRPIAQLNFGRAVQ